MKIEPQFFGKFTLFEKLGTGGMGEVYLAVAQNPSGINKTVALKMIQEEYVDEPVLLELFKREAELAIQLNHKNIVSLYEYGVEGSKYYVTMEYVPGITVHELNKKLQKKDKLLSPEELLFIAAEATAGLNYVHRFADPDSGESLNIIHRDISPQNIMVNFEGEVKIIDFGVAKTDKYVDSTLVQKAVGKLRYMSPEQLERNELTQKTDIFSLGIVLWELCTGQRIFQGLSSNEIIGSILNFQLPDIKNFNLDCPDELIKIISKATSKSPEDRYANAGELYKELTYLLNSKYPRFSQDDFRSKIREQLAIEIEKEKNRFAPLNGLGSEIDYVTDVPLEETVVGTMQMSPKELQEYQGPKTFKPIENTYYQRKTPLPLKILLAPLTLFFSLFSAFFSSSFYRLGFYISVGIVGLLIAQNYEQFLPENFSRPLIPSEVDLKHDLKNPFNFQPHTSRTPDSNKTSEETTKPPHLENDKVKKDTNQPNPNADNNYWYVWVESNPTGATVYRNGYKTEKKTPTYVGFKDKRATKISLRRNGYESKSVLITPDKNRISINLKRRSPASN